MKLKLIILGFFIFLYTGSISGQSVVNTTHAGAEPYTTIQDAIDNAATENGDIIEVSASTYVESITISKELTLQSASGAVTTIITGSIIIGADNVTIDGFTITNPGGDYAIYADDKSGIVIENNIISDLGPFDKPGTPSTSNSGIIILSTSVDISNISILNNEISQIAGGTYCSANGIVVGWSTGTNTISSLIIQNNTVSNITSSTSAWPVGRGAYGILINFGASGGGIVDAPQIINNTISNLVGLWAHGIGLEGNTPNALVQGNLIHDLTDYKSPGDPDATAIMVESNTGANTATIEQNSFYNTYLGVRNATALDVNVTYNYWGDNYPSDNIYNTGGGSVIYIPWLNSGTDKDGGSEGFQGDLSDLGVDNSDPDIVSNLINSIPSGGTLNLQPGTYNAFTINSPITLNGNGAVINHGSPAITVSSTNVNIIGFTFNYDSPDYAIDIQAGAYDVTITDCDFLNVNGASVGNGVINRGTGTVDARNNFWNSINGPTYILNPTGDGNIATNASTGTLLVSPWWIDLGHNLLVSIPELTAPSNTLTGVSLLPTFTWNDVNYETGYTLEVSTSPTFASVLASKLLPVNSISYQFTADEVGVPLNNSTIYYWRVIAASASGNISSPIWSFKTVVGISIGVGNPANGSEVYQYNPLYFSWYIAQLQGSIKFRIEVIASGTDPLIATWTNGPWDYSVDNIGQVYRAISGLSGGTKYWWRIIGYLDSNTDNAYDPVNDKVVVFSQHYNFTTKGGLVTAYPSWPLGGYTVYSLTPMFGWYTLVYEPAATYQIIVATSGSVDGNGMLNSGIVGTYPTPTPQGGMTYTIPGGELTYSTTYYWQVVTHYGSSQVYSSVASFVTYDDVSAHVYKPVLSYPIGGMTIYTDSPTLYWYGNAYNSSIDYSIEYSTTGGAPYTVWGTTTDNQFYSVSGLTPGQTYTWIVIADKGGSNEISSDPATFTITGGTSSYPVPTYPTGGMMVYSTTPSLGWYVSGSTLGWAGYYVKWKKTTGAVVDWAAESGTVINDINQTNYMVSPALEEGENYKWAVALYDGVTSPVHSDYVESDFSVYGGASSITINQSTPANGVTNISTNVSFYWWVSGSVSNITSYYVTYSPYSDPNLDPSPGTTTPSSNMFASANLSGGTTYKWKVTANISGGGTVESGWYEFTTVATSLAVQPTAGSPSYGVTLTSSNAELSWYTKAAPNENQAYEVEVSGSPMFENVQLAQETDKNSVKVENLDNGQYYWRVRGKNDEGNSYYSNIASFKVGSRVTDIKDVSIIPGNFEVYQNYPNPFNPTTEIKFALAQASFVSIKIYNMLGQEIKSLVTENKMAGTYSVQWNGDNNNGQKVTSGIYIYRVSAQSNVITKKMMLLK